MKIFIPVTGQFHNIGDVMHRRVLVNWLKETGEIHLYGGEAPINFIKGLKLKENEYVLYRDIKPWLAKYYKSSNSHLVFKPGENRLGYKRLIAEILIYVISRLKVSKSKTIRVGIAIDRDKTYLKILFKKILKNTDELYWRTHHSQEFFGIGKLCPDLAFYDFENEFISTPKKYLAISYRFDRKFPNEDWFASVIKYSKEFNLTPICITQVQTDNSRNEEISKKMGCNHLSWDLELSHLQQEERIENVLKETEIVLSDRLHVLIKGANFCANPIGLLTEANKKIVNHFSVIGIDDNMIEGYDMNSVKIFDNLTLQNAKKESRIVNFINAKEELVKVKDEIIKKLI